MALQIVDEGVEEGDTRGMVVIFIGNSNYKKPFKTTVKTWVKTSVDVFQRASVSPSFLISEEAISC